MFESIKRGMSNTRTRFTEQMNILLDRGPRVDEDFWEGLEEALILSDVGASAAFDIVERMRDQATRKALPDAYAVMDALTSNIAATFATSEVNVFDEEPVLILFVGINGAGKTTTVGKIASAAKRAGRTVLLGCADTFRAAAIEQLEEWSKRAGVEIVQRERGSDPASVCYDTIERGEAIGANFILIDTAGRLHTSDDLMRELEKVVTVVRKRSQIPVRTVLVIDATTGQNGLSQAKQFNAALDLDALVVTKLDGTAKGGIALAVSHELNLPIAMIGVGEGLDDLQVFDAEEFSAALIGAVPEDDAPVADDSAADEDAAPADAPEASRDDSETDAPLLEDSDESSSPSSDTSSAGVGLAEPEEEKEFSWKDDFGNPDEMVDALGAQRTLEVVAEEPAGNTEAEPDKAADAAAEEAGDAAAENADNAEVAEDEDAPKEKEGMFKRAWKWLSEG